MLFSYLKFALGLFFLFASFFVLSLFYVYPYIWYFGHILNHFRPARLFTLRFGAYFLLNNLVTPLLSYLVSLALLVVGSKLPAQSQNFGGMSETFIIITFPMTIGFFVSPFIAYYYNFKLLESEDRNWQKLIFFAFVTVSCYILFYHLFQYLVDYKTTQIILNDFGRV